MKPISPKLKKQLIIFSILVVVGLVLLSAGAAYGVTSDNKVIASIQKIYPAALVGSGMISIYDWNEYRQVALTNEASEADTVKAYEQLIRAKKETHVARKLRVSFDGEDVDRELNYYKFSNQPDYNQVLDEYFNGQESLFVKYFVLPQVHDSRLRMKFNQDLSANLNNYNRSQNLLNKIKQGQKFEDLAKTDSDDKLTGQLGGDLGFAPLGSFLPELQMEIQNNKLGEPVPHLVTSRLGYHIVYPVETAEKDGQKLWHVKHILVSNTAYEQWLNPQLKNVWVWQIK